MPPRFCMDRAVRKVGFDEEQLAELLDDIRRNEGFHPLADDRRLNLGLPFTGARRRRQTRSLRCFLICIHIVAVVGPTAGRTSR
jgi:hypothetical protein